ncbi:MAG: redoxin domain-containing protein [Bacteroidales bacterium]|nr:redoxin domain-containing protein [Bacteroidales bacterium]
MKIKNSYSFLKTIKLVWFICSVLVISTVSCDNAKDGVVTITGKIENAQSKTIYLELLSPGNIQTVAEVVIDDNGTFEILADTLVNSFYRLKLDDKNMIYLRLELGDEIEIEAEYPGIAGNYTISGSDDCKLLREMNLHLLESTARLNDMNTQIVEARKIPGYNSDSLFIAINAEARVMYDADREYLKGFISKNHKSAVIYMALYQYVSISPVLMISSDLETFEYALGELKKYHPDLEQTALLESEVSKEKLRQQQMSRDYVQLRPGVEAPDFVLEDAFSMKKSLSSLRGKNVVLAFWSSWNKPSSQTAAKLLKMCDETGAKLVLISLDTQKENWLSAIKSYGLSSATNLCDFKSWESSVLKIYGIKSLPTAILINSDGLIELMTQDPDDIKVGLNELKK